MDDRKPPSMISWRKRPCPLYSL